MSNLTSITRAHLPSHVAQRPSDAIGKEIRKSIGAARYTEREKLPGEALVRANDIWKARPYRLGDGDTPQVVRPGSMDAYALPSRGNRT